MLDAFDRAERYRELAEGCGRLAAIAFSTETRNHFLRMAEHYRTLAEADEPGAPPPEALRVEIERT
jgi:hypothetical protein